MSEFELGSPSLCCEVDILSANVVEGEEEDAIRDRLHKRVFASV